MSELIEGESRKLAAGDRLLMVYSDHRRGDPKWLMITKVGRIWYSTDYRYRVAVGTLFVDGGKYTSPGRCYFSEDEYVREKHLNASWHNLKTAIRNAHNIPSGLTVDDIDAAEALLKLKRS